MQIKEIIIEASEALDLIEEGSFSRTPETSESAPVQIIWSSTSLLPAVLKQETNKHLVSVDVFPCKCVQH